jgi:hypothetical protein
LKTDRAEPSRTLPRSKRTPEVPRRRALTESRRAAEIARGLFEEAKKGRVWAFGAIADAVEGTVDGCPPAIDVDALFEERLTVDETIRRIRRSYLLQ